VAKQEMIGGKTKKRFFVKQRNDLWQNKEMICGKTKT